MSFISYLKDGISLGSIYAIIALGYTMVYGIAKMLNFAHGDVIMVGAFVILTAVTKANMSPILAIILSVVICTAAGVVIEAVAYRPLRKASSNLAVLITAIGVSYLLQNLALLDLRRRCQEFRSGYQCSVTGTFRRTAYRQRCYHRNYPCMYRNYGRPSAFRKENQTRTCHAGCL